MKEIVYTNQGDIYKTSTDSCGVVEGKAVLWATTSDNVNSDYYCDTFNPPNSTEYDILIKVKSKKVDASGQVWIKTYTSTSQYRELLGMPEEGSVDINSLGLSLCPDVDVWGGIGEIEGKTRSEFIELYFNTTSSSNMELISNFYGLDNPLPLDNDLDSNRNEWTLREYNSLDMTLVLGSVVFKDNAPVKLKIYKYEKENNGQV